MNIYDISPYFVSMGVLLVVFSFSPLFKFIDEPPNLKADRLYTLDGLRGFLALGVFFHHSVINYAYLKYGQWELPPSRFYVMLGQVGVALFFMISGFLFWEKLLREGKRISWSKLYIGRIMRIAPVYYVAIFSVLAIVFTRSNFEFQEPISKVFSEILPWLGLGYFGTHDINAYQHTRLIVAGVIGTLHYEWLYYFSLRLTYYIALKKWRLIALLTFFIVMLISIFIKPGGANTATALFLSGMIAATLLNDGYKLKVPTWFASLGALACLIIIFTTFDSMQNSFSLLLLSVFFFIVCSGNDLFGLLTCSAAQRLGHISYSVYLMQGIVLTLFYSFGTMRSFAFGSDMNYWVTILICAFILTFISSILYVLIERPGIKLGRIWGNALATRLQGANA